MIREGNGEPRLAAQRRLAARHLKRCPLCGAINAVVNCECFVCRWHGTFQTDPEVVDEGLGELLVRCPELVDAMLHEPLPKQSWWDRTKERIRRAFGRPLQRSDWLADF